MIDSFIIPEVGQYLVMDYVEGEDLQSMLDRLGRLPEPQVLIWISQICDALAYLHNQSSPIIHRDIKPGNIKIRPDGRAMLVDFGIAKVYDPSLATTMGARAFTPGYSPPEQYGTGSTDRRSDIYALGATVYHLLTGKTPPDSIKRMLNRADMSPPRQLNDEISPNIEKIILRSTELDTDRRYQSVEELLAELRRPEAEIDSSAKTEAVPHSSVATRPVEKPEPVLQSGKTPPSPKATNASPSEAIGSAQVIACPKRRSPVWLYMVGGVTLLILTGLCVIFVFSKLLGSVFPAQNWSANPDHVGCSTRYTCQHPAGNNPVTPTFTPQILVLITAKCNTNARDLSDSYRNPHPIRKSPLGLPAGGPDLAGRSGAECARCGGQRQLPLFVDDWRHAGCLRFERAIGDL